jgi:parallel beta-helix repeat protein
MGILHVGSDQTYSTIQSAVNDAKSGDTVYVHAGTYVLAERLVMKSGILLQGESYNNTILVGGGTTGGVRSGKESNGWIYCNGISNFEICSLKFTSTATGTGDGGRGETRNCILLKDCSNVQIHDLYFQRYLYNDGIKCHRGNNVIVYDCLSFSVGHDFVEFLSGTKNSKVSNCKIDVQTNTGIRLDNASDCLIEYCTIYDDTHSGWCAIEIENSQNNNVIDRCIIRNMHGSTGNAAIQYVHASGSLTVQNCVMWDCPGGWVRGGSPKMIDNIFDADPQDEHYWVKQGYGYGAKGNSKPEGPVETDPTTPEEELTADFKSSLVTGKAPLSVNFTSITTGNPTGYFWVFEPETSGDYCSKHAVTAVHTFRNPGIYTVSLTIKNRNGSITTTKKDYIAVTDGTIIVDKVEVTTDGTGKFNCDGTDDQVEINKAIEYANENKLNSVHLKSGRAYKISGPIALLANVSLVADKSVSIMWV